MAQGMSLRTAENYKCKGPKAGVSWAPWREGEGLESAGGRERGASQGQTTEAPGKGHGAGGTLCDFCFKTIPPLLCWKQTLGIRRGSRRRAYYENPRGPGLATEEVRASSPGDVVKVC